MLQNSSQPSNNSIIFNANGRDYYRKKKDKLAFQRSIDLVVREDAIFIKYYGMDAYLKLFPDAEGFGMEWHRGVLRELARMKHEDMRDYLYGIRLAVGANLDKKAGREFKHLLKSLK